MLVGVNCFVMHNAVTWCYVVLYACVGQLFLWRLHVTQYSVVSLSLYSNHDLCRAPLVAQVGFHVRGQSTWELCFRRQHR